MPQSYAPALNIVNTFRPFKQRGGRLAFVLSCLLHLAAGAVLFFVARKFVFEQWPSMGPKSDNLNVVQMELLPAAASPEKPVSTAPPEPAAQPPKPADVALEKVQKGPELEPEPRPEPKVLLPVAASESPASAEAPTAQVAQSASAPAAQIESKETIAGQGRTGDADWRLLAIAKLRALVEREKYYPPSAQKAGYTGRFSVRIRIEPDGTISGCEIAERRGHPMLGRAVETAMQKIRGTNIGWSLPERYEFLLPVEFELK